MRVLAPALIIAVFSLPACQPTHSAFEATSNEAYWKAEVAFLTDACLFYLSPQTLPSLDNRPTKEQMAKRGYGPVDSGNPKPGTYRKLVSKSPDVGFIEVQFEWGRPNSDKHLRSCHIRPDGIDEEWVGFANAFDGQMQAFGYQMINVEVGHYTDTHLFEKDGQKVEVTSSFDGVYFVLG